MDDTPATYMVTGEVALDAVGLMRARWERFGRDVGATQARQAEEVADVQRAYNADMEGLFATVCGDLGLAGRAALADGWNINTGFYEAHGVAFVLAPPIPPAAGSA